MDRKDLPDPTVAEARALIVGTGAFWACWGLAVGILFIGGSAVGVAPFLAGFAAGSWLYIGGVFHIAARAEGTTVTDFYLSGLREAPWSSWRRRRGRGWWRIILPAYYRRAARRPGWPTGAVLGVLGSLLAADLVLFAVMMATTGSTPRGS